MKNTFKSFWSDLEAFQKQDNPWAICHAQGLTGDKFERCVMHVKEKLGVHKTSDIEKSKGDTVENHFGHKVREKDVFDWLQTRITGYREGGSTATRLIDDVVQHFAINHSDAVDLVHDFIEDAIPPEERGFFKSLIPAAIGASVAALTAKLQSMLSEPPFPAFEVTYELTDQLGKVSCQTFMVKEETREAALAKVKEMTDQMADFARTHDVKDVRVSDMREKSIAKSQKLATELVPGDHIGVNGKIFEVKTVEPTKHPSGKWVRIETNGGAIEVHETASFEMVDPTEKSFKANWLHKFGVDGEDSQSRLVPLPKDMKAADNYGRRGQEEKSMQKMTSDEAKKILSQYDAGRIDNKKAEELGYTDPMDMVLEARKVVMEQKEKSMEKKMSDDEAEDIYWTVIGNVKTLGEAVKEMVKMGVNRDQAQKIVARHVAGGGRDEKSQDDMDKMGVEGAGPVPNSLLARQDLEGKKKKPAEKSIVQLEDLADKAVDVDSLKEKHDLVGRIKARQLKDQKQTVDERKIKRITLEI